MGLWPRPGPAVRVCGDVPPGFARCAAWIRTDIAASSGIQPAASVAGYHPSDLRSAYGLVTASAGSGKGVTVAIVDAFDDPRAESDLQTYRAQFGLPVCSSANGCFKKVVDTKRTNTGWAEEESLDVDMVSAICPNCHILLVEAASTSTADLSTAEKYATSSAKYVSNSWSGNEGTKTYDSDYNVAGKIITAATGDSGFNATAQWPAILPSVVGVGGTKLSSISPRTESAWSGAGSGCSKVYAKPTWQSMATGCSRRAQSDVSAVADPNTGVAVYDTYHVAGWLVFGGTSVATPITASIYALSGNTESNATLYANRLKLFDVTSGSNGSCGAPLCKAGAGWDGPTGLGSPNGVSAY
ncbi:MAG TPA: S53 family peptidase [Candidatus Baltobacteraceae bacterium]|nr:S53 family peptidase [Candidatus Baltobacteraceae bacterium]